MDYKTLVFALSFIIILTASLCCYWYFGFELSVLILLSLMAAFSFYGWKQQK